MKRWRLLVLLIAGAVGCGKGSGVETAPVSGVVTLNGQPLGQAKVSFMPATSDLNAPGSVGITDDQGKYSLKVVTTNESGAMVGKHRVRITAAQDSAAEDDDETLVFDEPVPARYNSQSELEFDVTASGSTTANFELQKP